MRPRAQPKPRPSPTKLQIARSEILSQGSNDLPVAEQSRAIAECHLELQRIRAVQRGLFHDVFRAQNMDDLTSPLSAVAQILRYARRAVSRRKTALNKLFAAEE